MQRPGVKQFQFNSKLLIFTQETLLKYSELSLPYLQEIVKRNPGVLFLFKICRFLLQTAVSNADS